MEGGEKLDSKTPRGKRDVPTQRGSYIEPHRVFRITTDGKGKSRKVLRGK